MLFQYVINILIRTRLCSMFMV